MRKAEETSALETDVEEVETSRKRRKRVVDSDDSEGTPQKQRAIKRKLAGNHLTFF